MNLSAVLNLLADGGFHSGAALGEALGVSRTAIWKHLQKLDELGLKLVSVKGKGYCLEGGLELLASEKILAGMSGQSQTLVSLLDIHPVIDSTNAKAMAHAIAQNDPGYVCLAEQQTAGRGRRGRAWISPYGKNIYMSVLWGFDGGAAALEGLSLAVGVAIVRALESRGVSELELKWPNDVLWRGRKLAGVLLEMTGDVAGYCQVVVGIGLNVSMPAEFGKDIDQEWVDVSSICELLEIDPVSRNDLIGGVLQELMPMLNSFQAKGFACYRDSWESLDAFKGQEVELHMGNNRVEGRAVGVSDTGALRIESEGVEAQFNGGEISLRGKRHDAKK